MAKATSEEEHVNPYECPTENNPFLCLVALNLGLNNDDNINNREEAFTIIKNSKEFFKEVFCKVQGYLKGVVNRYRDLLVSEDKILALVLALPIKEEEKLLPTMNHNADVRGKISELDKKLSYLANIAEDTYPIQIGPGTVPWRFNPYIDAFCTVHVYYKLYLLAQDDPIMKRMQEQSDGKEQPCTDLKQEVFDLWKYHLKRWTDVAVPGFNSPKKISHQKEKNVVDESTNLQNQALQYQRRSIRGEETRPRRYDWQSTVG